MKTTYLIALTTISTQALTLFTIIDNVEWLALLAVNTIVIAIICTVIQYHQAMVQQPFNLLNLVTYSATAFVSFTVVEIIMTEILQINLDKVYLSETTYQYLCSALTIGLFVSLAPLFLSKSNRGNHEK